MDAVERIYRQISQPSPPATKPVVPVTAEPRKIELTREDVNAIIQRTRPASAAELEFILSNAAALRLTLGEKNQLSVDLTMKMAQRSRQVNGKREDPAAQFMSETLGLVETPCGMIERAWVNSQLRAGAQAIARCKDHRPKHCQCWAASRAILFQAMASGEKNPESWAARRIYDFLEELELGSMPLVGHV